jgi:hypothetical protein
MRDNHRGLPELLDAFQQGDHWFCRVKLELGNETAVFQFGIQREGYLALRRMFEMRPFDALPGLPHRFFVVHSLSHASHESRIMLGIRIEQGRSGKNFDVEFPKGLAANLLWFAELKSFEAASHLRVQQ